MNTPQNAREISFKQFRDGSILELIQEPEDDDIKFLYFNDGNVELINEYKHNEHIYVPDKYVSNNVLEEMLLLPSKTNEYESLGEIISNLRAIFDENVAITDNFKTVSI